VSVTSASITKSLEFNGPDAWCVYSTVLGGSDVILEGQNQVPNDFMLAFENVTLAPQQRTDTMNPAPGATNELSMNVKVDGYEYWWFNDYTAGVPSKCTTDFVALDETAVSGSTYCTDLVPKQGSADYTGNIESPGPHASATISFSCPLH